MIYLLNKGKRGQMLIDFLPNKESIKGAWANPMHFLSLEELLLARSQASQAETSVHYSSRNLFLYRGDILPRSCNAIGGSNKTWLVNRALAECAPDGIGGRRSQAGSEESDGGTARWIGDQLGGTDRDLSLYVCSVAS